MQNFNRGDKVSLNIENIDYYLSQRALENAIDIQRIIGIIGSKCNCGNNCGYYEVDIRQSFEDPSEYHDGIFLNADHLALFQEEEYTEL